MWGTQRTSENPGVPRAIASALKATSWPYVRSAAAIATPSPLYLLSQDRKMRHVFPAAPGVPGALSPTPAPAATVVEVSTAVGWMERHMNTVYNRATKWLCGALPITTVPRY